MSADNAIIICKKEDKFAVFEANFSSLTVENPLAAKWHNSKLTTYATEDEANIAAKQVACLMYKRQQILEYGIINMVQNNG